MHPVKSIRKGNILVDKTPIVYSWWFKDSAAKKLLNKLGDYISWQDVCKTTLKGECYFLLYIGKGKNGHTRLVDYHILDKSDFHTKGIKNGRISSLRASICGLLDIQMSLGKEKVDKFIDANCYVNWKIEKGDLKESEKKSIKSKYLPLNDHYLNCEHAKEHRKILRQCKKDMRK